MLFFYSHIRQALSCSLSVQFCQFNRLKKNNMLSNILGFTFSHSIILWRIILFFVHINNLFLFIAEKYVRDGCTSLVNHSFIHWKASVWFAVWGHK